MKQKLEADIEQLRQVSTEPSAEQGTEDRLRPDQTVDLGTSTQGVPTDEQNLDAELKGKLQQLHEVQKTIDEVETKVRPPHFSTGCIGLQLASRGAGNGGLARPGFSRAVWPVAHSCTCCVQS